MSEQNLSGCSAVGSALDWGSRGREFKSRHSDQVSLTNEMQAKIPHFGAGFLCTKSMVCLKIRIIGRGWKNLGA